MICRKAMKTPVMIGKEMLTPNQQQWLIDNYDTMSKVRCAEKLGIGVKVLRRIAKELGIWKQPMQKTFFEEVKPVKSKYDQGQRYCIDCRYYRAGGICQKKGTTGALHKKECFKSKKDEFAAD